MAFSQRHNQIEINLENALQLTCLTQQALMQKVQMKKPDTMAAKLEEQKFRCTLIQHKLKREEQPPKTSIVTSAPFDQDISISEDGVQSGVSLSVEPAKMPPKGKANHEPATKPQLRTGRAAAKSAKLGTRAAVPGSQSLGKPRMSQSSTRGPLTWQEKMVLIFDDMLYCIEQGLIKSSQATPLERQFVQG